MKYIILVGDGMGDYPLPELNNKTPLEAAETHAMDEIASHGELFLLQTVPEGYPPGSDVANLSLIGYRPELFYTGRSPLEAASMNVDLGVDEVAFRCNLVTIERDSEGKVFMKDYSAGHISTEEARVLIGALAAELNDENIQFHPGVSYRHLMVRKGEVKNLETVPPHDHIGAEVSEFLRQYENVAGLSAIIEKSAAILEHHEINQKRIEKGLNPANFIWLWGEGKAPSMPTLEDQYGVSGALISAVDLLKGIGVYAGMKIVQVPGATGYLDTNYQGKARAALEMLKENDLVLVHVEAPDEAAHQGSLKNKIQAIEDFDRLIVQPIFDGAANYDFRMAISMDHYTPVALRTHVSLPVPIAIYDSTTKKCKTAHCYTEKDAMQYGRLLGNGNEFMNILLNREHCG
jgi:2,3-bisphosphoglycerate-independent phosphoglycerate mutase